MCRFNRNVQTTAALFSVMMLTCITKIKNKNKAAHMGTEGLLRPLGPVHVKRDNQASVRCTPASHISPSGKTPGVPPPAIPIIQRVFRTPFQNGRPAVQPAPETYGRRNIVNHERTKEFISSALPALRFTLSPSRQPFSAPLEGRITQGIKSPSRYSVHLR